ncbi:hypothetical protein [Spirosoma arcticum]
MKKGIVIASLLIGLVSFVSQAQDTTRRSVRGLRFSVEVPLVDNTSLVRIQDKLLQTGLNADGVGSSFGNFVISLVRDNRKWMSETRFIGTLTTEDGPVVSGAVRRGRLYGFGLGFTEMYRLINTRRFIVGPMLGYDIMWYRLSLLPVDRDNVLLANVAANPAIYNPVTFRQGLYVNLHGGVGADVRVYWFKKTYDELRFGARVGYQLPFLRNQQWEFNDGNVADLPAFKANLLYYQAGLTLFLKKQPGKR